MDQDEADRARAAHHGGGVAAGFDLPRPVQAVVFDLDGTLLDTEPLYRRAFHAALATCGHSLPDCAYDQLVGLPSTTRRDVLPRLLGADFAAEAFFRAYYQSRARLTEGGVDVKPGATLLLDRLARAGVGCAVATSASAATASVRLAQSGLAARFAAVVSRDDVACGKPAPDSFLAAAARLGVAPADCLALEDSYPGVCAASDAGMMVVMVPDAVPPSAAALLRCCGVVGSLGELAGMSGRWRASEGKKGLLF